MICIGYNKKQTEEETNVNGQKYEADECKQALLYNFKC